MPFKKTMILKASMLKGLINRRNLVPNHLPKDIADLTFGMYFLTFHRQSDIPSENVYSGRNTTWEHLVEPNTHPGPLYFSQTDTPRTSILWPNTHPGPLYFSQTQAPDIYTLAKHTPRTSIFWSNTPPGAIFQPNTPPRIVFFIKPLPNLVFR